MGVGRLAEAVVGAEVAEALQPGPEHFHRYHLRKLQEKAQLRLILLSSIRTASLEFPLNVRLGVGLHAPFLGR